MRILVELEAICCRGLWSVLSVYVYHNLFYRNQEYWKRTFNKYTCLNPKHLRKFKKLRRLLQRERHIKIALCARLGVMRLFQVGHVVQTRRIFLRLLDRNSFHVKAENERFYCCRLVLSSETSNKKSSRRRLQRRTGKIFWGELNIIFPNETCWSQMHKMILSWRQVFIAIPWDHWRSK